tara:strand:- start:16050 stop:16862 length:813 start_codon:yes stop_codon:yes gene_type:complete
MKKIILTTVSAFALIGAMPALADTAKPQAKPNAESTTTGNIAEDAKEAWKDIKSDTAEAYKEIKATLIGQKTDDKNMLVVIDSRKTATGIIGHHVYNEKHEKLAKVTDIILDKDGKASLIVVSDGAILGMGKRTAFYYSAITRVESDGDVVMPITEEIMKKAVPFSYNQDKASKNMLVIPSNGYSVATLLKGRLLNEKREPVANIDNISLKDGVANQLIVSFDDMLGFGGERAVLSYNDAAISRNGNALDFQLNANKSAQFDAYKKAVKM